MAAEAIKQADIGLKVEGDLGDLQIIEESSESDDDVKEIQPRKVDSVATIPGNLMQLGSTPVFGTVAVTNSENVQFGNNTFFNGPVTIKQVVHTSGIENASYVKTDSENHNSKFHSKEESPPNTKFQIKTWHKLSFSALGIAAIGSICAVILITQNSQRSHDSQNKQSNSEDVSSDDLLIAPGHLRIVSRSDWLAQPVTDDVSPLRQPVPWVIITHTATEGCFSQSECVLRVRLLQTFHIESRGWSDIAYNFMVGGDGSAYYGRGWDQMGAHTKGYNIYSIGIAFIGTFNTEEPTKNQVDACRKVLELGVAQGKLAKDYKLFGHRQLMSTLSPGDTVFEIIKKWPHFVNVTDISPLVPKY